MEYRFADCRLAPDRHAFFRDGAEVHVEPQVFALLTLLAERAGGLVSRDDLVDRVWEGRIVSEATIAARISAARAAVGDTGSDQRIIRTITRRGLQLAVPVEIAEDAVPPPPVSAQAEPAPAAAPRVVVRMTQSRDGSPIAWSRQGAGPAILRAGHWMTHLERDPEGIIWGPWLERIGRGRTMVRYDPRGMGLSGPEAGAFSLEGFTDDLEAVADAAGLERFSLFATSQGAAVSFAYAARHPDRVERIFSYGGFSEGSRVRDPNYGDAMTSALGEMIRQGWGQPDSGQMRAFASLMLPSASTEQVADFVRFQSLSGPADRAVEMRDAISLFDVKHLLGKVRCPVCLVHVSRDALHPFTQAQILARLLPDAQLHALDGVNHLLLPDEPAFAQMFDLLDAFLAGDLD